MKRVIMVSPRYLPIIGGAEVQCNRLVNELSANYIDDVDVIGLVTRRVSPELKRSEVIDGLKVTRIGPAGLGILKEYIFCIGLFVFLSINSKKYDVIHCHATGIFGVVCSLVSKLFSKKVLLKISTNGEISSLASGKIKYAISSFLFKDITIVSLNAEGYNESCMYFPKANTITIPNGISDVNFQAYDEVKNNILAEIYKEFGNNVKVGVFVGRVVKRKGISELDELAQSGYLDDNNIVLFIVGDSSNQRDQYKIFSNSSRLIQAGSQKDVYPYLLASDFFISPSYYEGLPNTVLEALNVGKYCLLSNIEPHIELMKDHQNMIDIFKVKNTESIIECMDKMKEKETTTQKLHSKYKIFNVANQYIRAYRGEV